MKLSGSRDCGKKEMGGGRKFKSLRMKNKTFMIADRHPSPQLNLFHLPFFRCFFREVTYFPDMEYRKRYSLFAVHLLRLPNRNMIPTNALPLQTSLPKENACYSYPIPYILQQQSTVAALACTAARRKVGASGFSIGGAQQIILKREEG